MNTTDLKKHTAEVLVLARKLNQQTALLAEEMAAQPAVPPWWVPVILCLCLAVAFGAGFWLGQP